jgi:hypothetical protein
LRCQKAVLGAGFAHVARRLDIKIVPASQRAAAVHYFTGTSLFNRAMRYWCDNPVPWVSELAGKLLHGGTHFHLGNQSFSVRSSPAAAPMRAQEDTEIGVLLLLCYLCILNSLHVYHIPIRLL